MPFPPREPMACRLRFVLAARAARRLLAWARWRREARALDDRFRASAVTSDAFQECIEERRLLELRRPAGLAATPTASSAGSDATGDLWETAFWPQQRR